MAGVHDRFRVNIGRDLKPFCRIFTIDRDNVRWIGVGVVISMGEFVRVIQPQSVPDLVEQERLKVITAAGQSGILVEARVSVENDIRAGESVAGEHFPVGADGLMRRNQKPVQAPSR